MSITLLGISITERTAQGLGKAIGLLFVGSISSNVSNVKE